MSATNAVEVEGLVKHFGEVHALDGINLAVRQGSIVGLLGPNGAGKTTAVRVLTTLLKPDAGRAVVGGYDVTSEPDEVRKLIGLSGQYAAVDEYLAGRENLDMVGRLYHLSAADSRHRAAELLERFDLVDAADRPAKTYSGGMRRRLEHARPRGCQHRRHRVAVPGDVSVQRLCSAARNAAVGAVPRRVEPHLQRDVGMPRAVRKPHRNPLTYSVLAIVAMLIVFIPLGVRKHRQGGNA